VQAQRTGSKSKRRDIPAHHLDEAVFAPAILNFALSSNPARTLAARISINSCCDTRYAIALHKTIRQIRTSELPVPLQIRRDHAVAYWLGRATKRYLRFISVVI
jgi:hypothetical protein